MRLPRIRWDTPTLLATVAIALPFVCIRTLPFTDLPEHVAVGYGSASLFPLLGVRPMLGRLFTEQEDAEGAARTAVLTEAWWRKRFGADPNVVGRRLTIDGDLYTVIGVIPATVGLGKVDFWAPLSLFLGVDRNNRGNHPGTIGIGRSIHAGQVCVADGTPLAAEKLERVLTNDPGMGVIRHVDAGYEEAAEVAAERGVRVPMSEGSGQGA